MSPGYWHHYRPQKLEGKTNMTLNIHLPVLIRVSRLPTLHLYTWRPKWFHLPRLEASQVAWRKFWQNHLLGPVLLDPTLLERRYDNLKRKTKEEGFSGHLGVTAHRPSLLWFLFGCLRANRINFLLKGSDWAPLTAAACRELDNQERSRSILASHEQAGWSKQISTFKENCCTQRNGNL